MSKKKVILLGAILFLSVFISSLFYREKPVEAELLLEEKIEENIVEGKIAVDIKGAVQNPGVYELDFNARVKDVIEKSGGILESADTGSINLSKKLEDEMVIIIYTKEEIASFLETEQRLSKVDQTCVCPKIENSACIEEKVTNYGQPNTNQEQTKLVSLNQGTKEEFETLPGIGPSKAEAIIQYRSEHGNFNSIEEITNVSGIGSATFAKIKTYLTL